MANSRPNPTTPTALTITESGLRSTVPVGASPHFDVDALMAGWFDTDRAGIERRLAKRRAWPAHFAVEAGTFTLRPMGTRGRAA